MLDGKRIILFSRFIVLVLVFFITKPGFLFAADYYVDADKGKDWSMGNGPRNAWRTIARINRQKFEPGDTVYLKRGSVWEEQLTVSSSGSKDRPITFKAYGTGHNPIIKTSNLFYDWVPVKTPPKKAIWKGSIRGVRNSWGAVRDGKRLPRYYKYNKRLLSPKNLADMMEGYFFAPLHKGQFFIRNDAGRPEGVEIGTRKYGIYIKEKRHIIVEDIHVSGPGGREDAGGQQNSGLIVVEESDHVVIRNTKVTNHVHHGILIGNKSQNCLVQNVISYGHGSTGIFFSEAGKGNQVFNCEVFLCGNSPTDHGDMGLIGVWQTPGVHIEGCYVHDNGHAGIERIDAAISFVQSPKGIVKRCRIEDIGGTGIQFAEYSDNCIAAYNIINRWGIWGAKNANEGIRIGGGKAVSTAKGCKIYNNLFIKGGETSGDWAALRIRYYENGGLEVKNNIFHNNSGIYEIKAESRSGYSNWAFSNNLYYRIAGAAVSWGGKIYDYNRIIGGKRGYFSFDQRQDENSIQGDPKVLSDLSELSSDSPCIGNGTDVGLIRDFYNNPVPIKGRVNIGPFQAGPPS